MACRACVKKSFKFHIPSYLMFCKMFNLSIRRSGTINSTIYSSATLGGVFVVQNLNV